MALTNLPPEQIFNAYKKLKHYFFYDNTTLFVREKISIFEKSILQNKTTTKKRLHIINSLSTLINQTANKILENDNYLDKNLGVHILPKKIRKPKSDIVTNNSKDFNEIEIERFNFYINAPIEVHILSVLWVMFAGRYLNSKIGDYNYANKLNLDLDEDDLPQQNLKLYKPYFVQYQQWRDDAIKKAEDLLDEKRNVTILSLDIKEYFHSIRLDFEEIYDALEVQIEASYKFKEPTYKLNKNEALEIAVTLTKTLEKVHERYNKKIINLNLKCLTKIEGKKFQLPIGMISSGFLGNYYLKDLDKAIIEKINPAYYGRYVDDLMFVFSDLDNHVKPDIISPTVSFIYKNFVKKGVLKIDSDNDTAKLLFFKKNKKGKNIFLERVKHREEKLKKFSDLQDIGIDSNDIVANLIHTIKFKVKPTKASLQYKTATPNSVCYDLLEIQTSKIVLHYFNWKESRAVLNIFKKRLEKQRSEFRFLPDEDEISEEFDEEAFSLKYNDSENKFRSIEDFSENKYGASKFLAKKIFAISFGDKEDDKTTDKQILTFFKESTSLGFYSLWEKVATYFVIGNKTEYLLQFKKNVDFAIKKIKTNESDSLTEKLRNDLGEFLKISFAISMTLNPKIEFEKMDSIELAWIKEQKEKTKNIRNSNLFRTSLMSVPCINFTSFLYTNHSFLDRDYNKYFSLKPQTEIDQALENNKIDQANSNNKKEENAKEIELIDEILALLAPNYIPYHEVNILKIISTISSLDENSIKVSTNDIDLINAIPDNAFKDYYKINYSWKKTDHLDKDGDNLKSKYFLIQEQSDQNDSRVRYFNIAIKGETDENIDNEKIDKKIALANLKVENENIEKSIIGCPNLNRARRKNVFRLLNEADRLDSDMIIFPEVSTPYSWLRLLAERSQKRSMAVVAGLEHWINSKGVAFNFMATILPFKVHDYTTSLIKIRLKNHYSPAEIHQLKGYQLLIPRDFNRGYKMSYDLFHWRRTYFSIYNCFELADIYHRSLFKSKVDFIVASEYNKDTSYFSDVAGAWVRDVHTYFIQVNSSDFGDSRLIQPAKSFAKDLIQVKGGMNSTILVGNLEIEKLRKFQRVEYHLQKDLIDSGKYFFKPTPPDFDRSNVIKRTNNSLLQKTDHK